MIKTTHLLLLICIQIVVTSCSAQNLSVDCGVQAVHLKTRIFEAEDTISEEWPWHVSILHRSNPSDGTWEYRCGGTLVYKHFIITARHCVVSQSVAVKIGDEQYVVYRVYTIEGGKWEELNNDIALVELRTEVPFSELVRPVCLPGRDVVKGETGVVVGFGRTEHEQLSSVLKLARMPVIDPFTCVKSDPDNWGSGALDRNNFCAGHRNGTAVCNGDSGGGLVFWRNSTWQIGGIVSFSPASDEDLTLCRTDGYAAYTGVYEYTEWIEQKISERGEPVGNKLSQDCGQRTNNSESPWVVAIYAENSNRWEYRSLGTLISQRYVLSTYTDVSRLRVLLRANEAPNWLTSTQFGDLSYRNVDEQNSRVYSQYYSFPKNALLRMSYEVSFDDHLQPVCLPLNADPHGDLPEALTLVFRATNNGSLTSRKISKSSHPQCYSRYPNEKESCLEGLGYHGTGSIEHRLSIVGLAEESEGRHLQYASLGHGFYIVEKPFVDFGGFSALMRWILAIDEF